MKIGGFIKSTLIDYPGKITCVVFTQGCMFRCKYCHNPELVDPKKFEGRILEADILKFLETRIGKLEGVVVSGGEPTVQPDLLNFISKVKAMGFLVKLDTCGYFPDVVARLLNLNLLDYIAMDIKAPLARYEKTVQFKTDARKLKRSIELIMNSGIEYEFRTTVVKQLLSEKELIKIAKTIKGAKNYYLQKFVPNRLKIMDKSLCDNRQYSNEDFLNLGNLVKPYVCNFGIR